MALNKKNPIGFDWAVLSKVIAMLTAGLLAGVFWLYFRIPETCVMFVIAAAFITMVELSDVRWSEKLKNVFYMILFSGTMQFFIAMLINEKYLLLIWIFGFSFSLLYFWTNRAAATVTLAIGSLSIALDSGFQPGAERFIDLMIAGCCSIAAMSIVEYATVPMRIQIALRQYLTVLIMHMESIIDGDDADKRCILKMKVLKFADRANAIIAGERFFRVRYIAMALKAQHVLERLHRISRAIIVFENSTRENIAANQASAEALIEEMRKTAGQINKGDVIKNKCSDLLISSEANMAADSLRIIARELAVINGHCL